MQKYQLSANFGYQVMGVAWELLTQPEAQPPYLNTDPEDTVRQR